MNYNSLLNLGFLGKIATFFDIIPKIVYFLYAAISSGVDAMQALVRKLAGLDVYYNAGGTPVTGQDPLTEFLYGILGIGESAPVYEALNAVFWSLAIFGVIVLVISTIIAIIKSHYNEDTAGTSPWKYIYTSLKAVFTFVVVPVAVVVGMQLTSFLLRTIDQITAGAGSAGEVEEMYGKEVADLFLKEKVGSTESYAHYDYFGAGAASTTTTFSGMLFNASLYSANRVRDNVSVSGVVHKGVQIFGNSEVLDGIESGDDKKEYIAQQVDYAFANCLTFNEGISYSVIKDQIGDGAPVWGPSDIFGIGKKEIDNFSKFDVSAVWLFYNLWKFNLIVGFVGGFTVFVVMISIIVGLMTRLIKGAALFLIYPSILGLAPMDNFKAFKSWGTNFMQQILMAVGSIVGINILLLLLPYLQSIKFFNVPVIDFMVNLVILIAGLLMAKDFISMVSGFIGGADANSIGSSMKGEIAGNIKKGASMGVKAGKLGVGVLTTPVKAGVAAGKTIGKTVARGVRNHRNKSNDGIDSAKKEYKQNRGDLKKVQSQIKSADKAYNRIDPNKAYAKAYNNELKKLKKKNGGTISERDKMLAAGMGEAAKQQAEDRKQNINQNLKKLMIDKDENISKVADSKEKLTNAARAVGGDVDYSKKGKIKKVVSTDEMKKRKLKQDYEDDLAIIDEALKSGELTRGQAKAKKQEAKQKYDENMEKIGLSAGGKLKKDLQGFGQHILKGLDDATSWKNIGKSIADSFKKTVDEAAGGLGIDKAVKGAAEVLKSAVSTSKPSPKGDDLVKDQGAKREAEAKENKKLLEKQIELLGQMNDNLKKGGGSSSGGSGGNSSK